MMMESIEVSQNAALCAAAKGLYLSAFPKNERLPWWVLRFVSKRAGVSLSAYLSNGCFCGMTYHVETDRAVMIMFFAVDPSLRSKGYGSAILAHLKEKYAHKALLLHIEPTDDPTVNNYDERIRRLCFYQKNGFFDTGLDVFDVGGRFRVLATAPTDVLGAYRQAFYRLFFHLWRVRLSPKKEGWDARAL